MSYDKITDRISVNTLVFEGYAEENIENDVRLADYYPDVERIIKVENLPQITGKRLAGEKLYVDGTLLTRVYYVSENTPKLSCVSVFKMFSHSFELNSGAGLSAYADTAAVIQYKNARLINPRKIELTTSIGISAKVFERTETEFLSDITNAEVELYRRDIQIDNYIGSCERVQKINEEFALPEAKPPVNLILKTSAFVTAGDIKAITNKAVMKGELKISIIYMAEEGNIPERMEYSIPVTQIIDLDGIDENSKLCAHMQVDEHKLELIPTPTGEIRAIKIEAQVSSFAAGYAERSVTVCTDIYSITDEIEEAKNSVSTVRLIRNETLSDTVKETLEFSKNEVKQIFDVWGTLTLIDKEESAEKITVKSNLCATVTAYDLDGKLCCVDSDIPIVFEIPIKEDVKGVKSDISVSLASIGYTLSGDSYIDIRAEINYGCRVFAASEETVLTGAEKTGDKNTGNYPLTVYFASDGENIWNIAKAHNASINEIMTANNLDGYIINKRMPIEIPGK